MDWSAFWQANQNVILASIITAIAVLLISEPLKAGMKKLGKGLESFFSHLGIGFRKTYLRAISNQHCWLPLIGIYNKAIHSTLTGSFYRFALECRRHRRCPAAWLSAVIQSQRKTSGNPGPARQRKINPAGLPGIDL